MKDIEKMARSEVLLNKAALPLCIFLLAFLIRFLYILQLKDDTFFNCLYLDPGYYSNWAHRISGGDWLGGKEAFEMTPLYAYFLAFIYRFVTTDLFIVRVFQIVIGSISCVLIYNIARDLFKNKTMGILAGLTAVAYGPFIFYDGMIMKAFLAVFFALLVIIFLQCSNSNSISYPLLAGLSLALAALVRENIILLIPVIPLWFLISKTDRAIKSKLFQGLFFLIGVAIVILPVTLRNFYVGNELIPITAGGGEVFFIGNNPNANGSYLPPDFIRTEPEFEHEDFRKKARELTGRDLTRKESSSYWYSQGIKFIVENPLEYTKLMAKKFVLFWNFYEYADNQNYYFFRTHSSVLGGPWISFGIIAPLSLLGIFLTLRDFRRFSLIHIAFLTYMVSVLIFFNFARFRLPAVSFLIIFGVYSIWWFAERLKERKFMPVLLCLPVILLLYKGVNYNMLEDDPYRYKFDFSYASQGICYSEANKIDEAFSAYKNALLINPGHQSALLGIANIFYREGQVNWAKKVAKVALDKNFNADSAHNLLGEILSVKNDLELAIGEYKKAIELAPRNPHYYYNLGSVLHRKGLYAEAVNAYQDALEIDPEFVDAIYGLARAYEALGEYSTANKNYEKIEAISPR